MNWIIERIQKVANVNEKGAIELNCIIDAQFSGFYWNDASDKMIDFTILRAVKIQYLLNTVGL